MGFVAAAHLFVLFVSSKLIAPQRLLLCIIQATPGGIAAILTSPRLTPINVFLQTDIFDFSKKMKKPTQNHSITRVSDQILGHTVDGSFEIRRENHRFLMCFFS